MVQVAQVMTQKRLLAGGQGKNPFQLAPTASSGRGARGGQPERLRGVAPRPPDRQLGAATIRVTESSQRT